MESKKPFQLRHRIVSAVILLLIPVSLFFAWVARMAIHQVESQIAEANLATLRLYVNTLQNEILETEKFLAYLAYEDETFQEFTSADAWESSRLYREQVSDLLEDGFKNNPDLTALAVYRPEEDLFFIKFALIEQYSSTNFSIRMLYLAPILYVVVALLALVLELVYLRHTLFAPLDHLVQVMEQLQSGDLSARLKEQKSAELVQVQYIQNHLEENLRRDEIASHVHLNRDYLSRIFSKEMGMSLKEYITEQKMKAAQGMLRTTNFPINFIGAKLGYCNSSHFSSTYKKVLGRTPQMERAIKED